LMITIHSKSNIKLKRKINSIIKTEYENWRIWWKRCKSLLRSKWKSWLKIGMMRL